MRRLAFAILAAGLALLISQGASAEENKPRPGAAKAQKLIDDCWASSLELRSSPVTADMANGNYETIKCLEQAILDQTETLFAGRNVTRDAIRGWLDQIAMLRKYYSNLWGNNRSCLPSCGTIQLTLYAFPHARLLEEMLRDTIEVYEDPEFEERIDYDKQTSRPR